MEIKTRFNKKDTVWTVKNCKAVSGKVVDIEIKINEKEGMSIKYMLKNGEDWIFVSENESFISKEELIKNL